MIRAIFWQNKTNEGQKSIKSKQKKQGTELKTECPNTDNIVVNKVGK